MASLIDSITNPLKTAGETAQKLVSLRDTAKFGDAVIELQTQIMTAQQGALAAHQRETVMAEEIRDLEKEVARFEAWDTEKERYELKEFVTGQLAYVVKEEARGSEPPHMLCANCYGQNQKSILQAEVRDPGQHKVTFCQNCGSELFSPDSGGRGGGHTVVKSREGSWNRARRGR